MISKGNQISLGHGLPGAGQLMHFNLFDHQNTPIGRIVLFKFFHLYRFINHFSYLTVNSFSSINYLKDLIAKK